MIFGKKNVKGMWVRFTLEKKTVWVNVADMLKVKAENPDWKANPSAAVTIAKKKDPKSVPNLFDKLPVPLKNQDPSTALYWHYDIDLDLAVFDFSAGTIKRINKLITKPFKDLLKEQDTKNAIWGDQVYIEMNNRHYPIK